MIEDQICLNVISYFHEFVQYRTMNLQQFIYKAAELDFRTVEICDKSVLNGSRDYISHLNRVFFDCGVKPVCMDIRNDFSLVGHALDNEISHVIEWLDISLRLGIKLGRIWLDCSNKVGEDFNEKAIRALEKIIPFCEKNEICMVVENHCDFSYNVYKHNSIIEYFNSPFLHNCVDFERIDSTCYMENFEVLCNYVQHIHAKAFTFTNEEEDNFSYPSIGELLRKINYSGYYSIEYEGVLQPKEIYICLVRNLIKKYFP